MVAGRTRLTLGLLAMIALLGAAILVGGPAALILGPAVLAAIPLLLRRYPGEGLIHRLAAARRTRRPRARDRALPRAPRTVGLGLAPLAVLGASRAPPALA